MSRIMKDHKKLKPVPANLPYPRKTSDIRGLGLALLMLLLVTTIYLTTVWLNQPKPETDQDSNNLISPEVQSFLESYHQQIDTYGVE